MLLTNFHTHTTYCDGKSKPEEIVRYALDKGFKALGFSGHGFTDYDSSYCMKEIELYKKEILDLKGKYKDKIQIYLGIEEDCFSYINRDEFEYMIGSCHYFLVDGKYYPIDSNADYFKKCLEIYGNDELKLAEDYYSKFTDYILKRKPDIVGHYDLITKFDECDTPIFFGNEKYYEIAEKYLKEALKSECIFEVNTGAISRGYRKTPYPDPRLLNVIHKNGGKIILSSDSHSADTLDCHFKESIELIKDAGFEYVYTLYDGKFIKDNI